MYLPTLDQIIQLFAWFLALTGIIIGLYVLVLNFRHVGNRHTGAFLFLFAAANLAIGRLMELQTAEIGQAQIYAMILAFAIPALQPTMLSLTVALFKPEWLAKPAGQKSHSLWKILVRVLLYGLILLPVGLTLVDVLFGTRLYFTGLTEKLYQGGLVAMENLGGPWYEPLQVLYFDLLALVNLGLLIDLAARPHEEQPRYRGALWLLLAAQIYALISRWFPAENMPAALQMILPDGIFAAIYTLTSIAQIVTERRPQLGSLRLRMTSLMMVVILPVLILLSLFMVTRAQNQLKADALKSIETYNKSLSSNVFIWTDTQSKLLQELASRSEIYRMSAVLQRNELEKLVLNFPQIYLASTTDMNGINVARSDGGPLQDYSNSKWFTSARSGLPNNFEVVVGETSGEPSLVLSSPIRNRDGSIVGVAMFATDLDVVTGRVQAFTLGESGVAYVVDANNLVIAHPDRSYASRIVDMSDDPAVRMLRQGARGLIEFVDEQGVHWYAYVSSVVNDWGIIVKMPESEILAPVRLFQQVAMAALLLTSLLMTGLTWLIIYQVIQPIHALTDAARSVASGDLDRTVAIESEDEIGVLARSFNSMTGQLRSLVRDLEARVAERTRALERRAIQSQVTAEVAREAAAIRDLEELLEHTVNLITNRFNFYHTGIFLLDDAREYAVLRAASSEGGRRMLARGHRLQVGQTGIVGYVAAKNEPRIALDVGADAVFFDNPDLPMTRSEAGLPLTARGQVIGVLDVQSTEEAAFDEENIKILQILADQIALAIENAHLLQESQQTVQELEALYGKYVRQSWQKRLANQPAAFIYDRMGVQPAQGISLPPDGEYGTVPGLHQIDVPIVLRGQKLGSLVLRRPESLGPWQEEEKALIQENVAQIALALENARLIEEVQRQASREHLVNQLASQVQSSLDLDTVMKVAVTEISRMMDFSRVQVRLNTAGPTAQPEETLRRQA